MDKMVIVSGQTMAKVWRRMVADVRSTAEHTSNNPSLTNPQRSAKAIADLLKQASQMDEQAKQFDLEPDNEWAVSVESLTEDELAESQPL